jgi:ribulose-5-phosphate 4-epimerase/fuculose-1-phosphate aldolase
LWKALLGRAPTTSNAVEYGTPEMAQEIMRLFEATDVQNQKILVMAGHEAGIVTFGKNLEEAFAVLMRKRQASSPCNENGFHKRIPRRHEG